MGRYTGPKNKLARREGQDLGFKTPGSSAHASLQKRVNVPPGEHGHRYRRRMSDYGVRLREKQKAKRMYGLQENKFRKYVEQAVSVKGNTIDVLVEQLERRLDNVLYRLSLAPTRASARQFVSHGHIDINEKKVDIPSYQVKEGDKITLRDSAKKIPAVVELLDKENVNVPEWLTRYKFSGKISALPNQETITEPVDWQYIIEFYTR